MVKQALFILILFFSVTALSYADGFSASVDQTTVSTNEPIQLDLELSGLQAKGTPDLSVLSGKFQVVSQAQSSMTKIINGDESSSVTWSIGLVPLQTGALTIPPISISTNQGVVSTQPVSIQVSQNEPQNPSRANGKGSTFTAHVSEQEVYKGQPVLVTFKFLANQSVRNLQLGDLQVKDAIVERVNEPKVQTEIVGGRKQSVMAVSYRVTPMKDGELVIPPLVLRGEGVLQASKPAHRRSSFFGDDEDENDPFARMHQMMEAMTGDAGLLDPFGATQPLTFMSKPVSVHVLPAVAGMNPWLPASHLSMSETLSDQKPKAGEAFTGTLSTEITGLPANQLPSFEEQFHSTADYKVYFDQPEITTPKGIALQSSRKDRFTVIPEKSGPITLPAIKLTWWDTVNRVEKTAVIPERTLQVLPCVLPAEKPEDTLANHTSSAKNDGKNDGSVAGVAPEASGHVWMWVSFALGMGIAVLFTKKYFLKRDPSRTVPASTSVSELEKPKKIRIQDLETCMTVNDVRRFLMEYAELEWGFRRNCPLAEIFSKAELLNPAFGSAKCAELKLKMENALYANKALDLDSTKKDLGTLLRPEKKFRREAQARTEYLPTLNPS